MSFRESGVAGDVSPSTSGVAGDVYSGRRSYLAPTVSGFVSSTLSTSSGSRGSYRAPGFCATCFKENPSGGWMLGPDGRCSKHGGSIGQALG
ncbi:MAG: hypothetical protein H7Y20_13080 [Bryobacteraceae bacterium]|nr:hypothetical protein [Bryobacteraceae bacterium]